MSSKDYGYWAGYLGPTTPSNGVTNIDRLDYGNDTAAMVVRANMPLNQYGGTGTHNQDYGYYGGGQNLSTVQRLDFSNYGAAPSPKGPMSAVQGNAAGFGNQARGVEGVSSKSYGYFSECNDNPAPDTSRVHRLDYSNDTATTLERGRLAVDRSSLATTHNINYGYWMGGPATATAIQRTDFSNDTATSLDRADLSVNGHDNAAGFGNMSYGYCAGGGDVISIIDRLDYSSDTTTTVAKGTLTTNKGDTDAASNSAYGYGVGGATPSTVSTVDRLDFSSDTTN